MNENAEIPAVGGLFAPAATIPAAIPAVGAYALALAAGYTVEATTMTSGVDMVTRSRVWGVYLPAGRPGAQVLVEVADSEAEAWRLAMCHQRVRR